jgi:hypothetical protein
MILTRGTATIPEDSGAGYRTSDYDNINVAICTGGDGGNAKLVEGSYAFPCFERRGKHLIE